MMVNVSGIDNVLVEVEVVRVVLESATVLTKLRLVSQVFRSLQHPYFLRGPSNRTGPAEVKAAKNKTQEATWDDFMIDSVSESEYAKDLRVRK